MCGERIYLYKNFGSLNTWQEAYDKCLNYDDGKWTLPTPDCYGYNYFLNKLNSNNTIMPLGFSDKLNEGKWINVYTGKILYYSRIELTEYFASR